MGFNSGFKGLIQMTVLVAIGLSTDHPQNARGPGVHKRFLRQQTDAVNQGGQKFFFENI